MPETKRRLPDPTFVLYEFEMFGWLMLRWAKLGPAEHYRVKNMVLESVLLHARVLADFFDGKGGKDDVKASDFPDFRPRFGGSVLEARSRKRINKCLLHLSAQRRDLHGFWIWHQFVFIAERCHEYLTWLRQKVDAPEASEATALIEEVLRLANRSTLDTGE